MKLAHIVLASVAAAAPSALNAAITVSTTPVTEAFDAVPAPTEWATTAVTTTGGGAIIDSTALDTAVNALEASGIATALPTSGTNPPSASNLGWRYNTGLQFLQTRPTGADFTILKATLLNGTATSIPALSLSFDYSTATTPATVEEIPGVRLYYSLTGAAGSWTPEFTLDTTAPIGTAETISRTITFSSPWAPGAEIFLAFADDNGSPTDPSYHIDNVRLVAVPEPSAGLLALGAATLLGFVRRKR